MRSQKLVNLLVNLLENVLNSLEFVLNSPKLSPVENDADSTDKASKNALLSTSRARLNCPFPSLFRITGNAGKCARGSVPQRRFAESHHRRRARRRDNPLWLSFVIKPLDSGFRRNGDPVGTGRAVPPGDRASSGRGRGADNHRGLSLRPKTRINVGVAYMRPDCRSPINSLRRAAILKRRFSNRPCGRFSLIERNVSCHKNGSGGRIPS